MAAIQPIRGMEKSSKSRKYIPTETAFVSFSGAGATTDAVSRAADASSFSGAGEGMIGSGVGEEGVASASVIGLSLAKDAETGCSVASEE